MHYAYIYTDPSRNDEPFYVGKGHKDRCYQHLRPSYRFKSRLSGLPFYNRLSKMIEKGIKPNITKIECSDSDTAYALEIGLIKTIGRRNLGKGSLLNLCDGGRGPNGKTGSWDHINKDPNYRNAMQDKHHSEEARELQSIRAKASFKNGRVNPMTGVEPKVKGFHWYNNGTSEVMEAECPVGFSKGRLSKSEETIRKISLSLIGNTRRHDYEVNNRN